MHQSRKPVRKCNGCGLNLHDHCGVYDNPHTMWHRYTECPGFGNEQLLAEYTARMAKRREDERKLQRKLLAKQRASEDHHNGDRHTVASVLR